MAIIWIFRACFTSLGSKHVGSLLLPPFLLLETREALPVNGIGSCRQLCLLHAANSSFTSFVYTLMQNSTPISPFHKGDKSFLWKRQPKSPSVYAELKRFGFYANGFCFDFFFSSLCLRDSVIFAQCAPHVLTMAACHSCPDVQLTYRWCVGQCCAQALATSVEQWLGVGAPLLVPGGAAGPWVSSPGVRQWSPNSSVAASSAGGSWGSGGGIPSGLEVCT